jgi:hypothetical protein
MPYQGDGAAFWLLVEDGEPELRRTDVDVDAVAATIRASGYPDAEDLVNESFVEPVEAAYVARLFEDRAQSG